MLPHCCCYAAHFLAPLLPFVLCFVGVPQDVSQVHGGSELVHRVQMQTAVYLIGLVEEDDQRASQCPTGQRLLRIAGGRDQVGLQSFARLGEGLVRVVRATGLGEWSFQIPIPQFLVS